MVLCDESNFIHFSGCPREKSQKTVRHLRAVTALFTFVSDSESRTMPGTLWIFSECERKGEREGGGKARREGEREGKQGELVLGLV